MKTRSWFSKFLTASLAVLMLTGMAPADASAATREAEETEPGSNLFMGKTATLQDDGTYTIQLEAFSTGESTTVMTQTPTDIVLVLDVSGSMEENFTYVSGQEWTSVTDTVASTPDDAYHHCPDGSYSPITWTETGWAGLGRYRYVCDNCHASRKWDSPTVVNGIPGEGDDDSWNLWRYTDIERTEEKMVALKEAVNSFLSGVADRNANIGEADQQHRVSIVKFASETTRDTIGNDTYPDGWYDYNYTQTIAGMTTVTSDSLGSLTGAVNELTPGGATAADKGLDMAQSILNNNSTDSSRNKAVVFFTDGEPTYGSSFSDTVANNAIGTANELKASGTTIYTIGLFSGADPSDTRGSSNAYMNGVSSNYPNAISYTNLGSGGNNGYYKTVSNTNSLADIFEEIEESINTTTVTLTGAAEIRDILNTGFVLTDASEVTVQTDDYSGRDSAGNRVFAGNPQTYSGAAVTKDTANNTIKVSGFNFSQEYLIDGNTPDESDFTAAVQGSKLIITITNVEATDSAVTNGLISTNNAASGIYENSGASTPFAVFEQPQTQLSSKAYVVDYAKAISTADIPNSVTNLSVDGMKKFTSSVTSLNKEEKGLSYGTATADSYTPATTNWNGYDTYYAFGQWKTVPEGVTTGNNTWTKISVIPANNVYYEDDFTTSTSSGTVGIEYTGTWTVDGTSSGNTETPNTEVHGGWQNGSLADDAQYSDGSAHVLQNGATATFTFTGTGVDVYSRTNMTTGYVAAQLYKGEDTTAAALSQYLVVDNQAESGNYYQIPTVSFTGLDHGTYTVKLTVAATSDNRSTYYLDGIRVYNPLSSEQEADSTVSGAYDDEVGAVFTEVRDILIDNANINEDGTASLSGAVFLDKHKDSTEGTYSVGEYFEYGPKNEVYLAKGQAVAIATGSLDKISIGLKAPEGETKATVTNSVDISPIPIGSASDLYYQVTANEQGFVVVENTGDNLLAITKVKTSGTGELVSFSLADMLSYANEFDSLNVVDYTQEPSDEDQTVTEPSDPSDTEEGDVVIENPSETPDQDDAAQPENPITAWFNNLINGIKNLFGRW